MVNFNKDEIKSQITIEQIYELLEEWGGEPEYTVYGILSATICHNPAGDGSRKLYYYSNNNLFYCYSNCGGFDIFQLVINVMNIQKHKNYEFFDAVKYLAYKFNIFNYIDDEEDISDLEDWEIFKRYQRINSKREVQEVKLDKYDDDILSKFNYNVKIRPWLSEGISQEVINHNKIGFYPGGDQITIPHYDKDGNFIGLRGRALNEEEAELYGKYRPIKIFDIRYSHPLGMNLYNLNNSKDNIKKFEKAIVFESEKSTLLYQTYFGEDNDISVACCGSNISIYQIDMLIKAGAKEIIIAFDRQFQEVNDDEFKKLTKNLKKIHSRFKNYVNISIIFDKNKITSYKASPIDEGPEKFIKLFKERIIL